MENQEQASVLVADVGVERLMKSVGDKIRDKIIRTMVVPYSALNTLSNAMEQTKIGSIKCDSQLQSHKAPAKEPSVTAFDNYGAQAKWNQKSP
jgi:hypothetical protein